MTLAAVGMLVTAACSSASDETGGSTVDVVSDPAARFCSDWQRFDTLTDSDRDPTPALVQEVIELQDEMGAILPEGLESEWASILAWNEPFIDHFDTAGYDDLAEDVFVDLFGSAAAFEVAGQAREDAYNGIGAWSRQNCPDTGDDTFCDLWPAYDEFLESEVEPTEELIAELLDMQSGITEVLPPDLTTSWTGIVGWNQAFIDVFEQVGYGPVTEQTFEQAFGGDEEAAGAAEEALEAGFATIRAWTASNCTDGSEHAVTFCEHWDEFAFLIADEDAMTPESYDEAIAVIDRVGDDVPAEIRSDWNAVAESTRGFHDVLVSVNFEPERITDELLDQAFGSVEAAVATEEAADAGRVAIEEWALRGCGDFCNRWPDLRRALDETGSELWWVGEEEEGENSGSTRLAEHLRAFEIGSLLVPDEIRQAWDVAVAARLDWIAWWEWLDFRGDRLDSPEARQQGLEILRKATYLTEEHEFMDAGQTPIGPERRRVIAAWQGGTDRAPAWLWTAGELAEHEKHEIAAWLEGTGEAPNWIVEMLHWPPRERFGGQPVATLDEWVGENCEAVTRRPGTIKVRFPKVEGAAGDTLVLALMDPGATFEDLTDQERVLAGTCAEIGSDPWGVWRDEVGREERWESEEFRSERWEESTLCDYRGEEGPARLDAGTYTMLAAVVEGRPGRDVTGTTSACAAFDVLVDGDTVIDMPDLPPCRTDLGGADDPWRKPPAVDPSTPGTGTLQIVFPDLIGDENGGRVQIVVLPGDTTLNDVGREQVWPVGAMQTWLFDPRETLQEGQERLAGQVNVPVAELPPSGSPRSLEPHWLAEGPPIERLPLVVLAPGTYDVHVQIEVHDPPEQEHSDRAKNDRCGTFEVTISGDTVVDLPELGECPRVA